jgi:transposase
MTATISDGRITVTFSRKAAAADFNNYLKCLNNDFYDEQVCELAELGAQVSLNLPSGIVTEPQRRPKDVDLIFDSAQDAEAWEKKMILWNQKLPEANKRRLSRDLTFEKLNENILKKLGEQQLEQLNANGIPRILVESSYHESHFVVTQPALDSKKMQWKNNVGWVDC